MDDFRPFLRSRHLQTIWPPLFRRVPEVATRSEVWDAPDGEILDLELLPHREGAPGVIVMHGLEGSSQAIYVRGILAGASARGWNGVAINFRSCGPTPRRFPPTYHSGFTADLDFVAGKLASRWPKLGVVGFSLGGNVALKWLGEKGESAPAAAAVTVSVPYDLAACAASLDAPGFWSSIYRVRFLRTLRAKALQGIVLFPGQGLDAKKIRAARTLFDFDQCVTAPLHGFAGAADYYAKCSSAGFLGAIRRPALLVSAEDDPFIPSSAIPREIVAKNPLLTLRLSPHGGHVGFVEGFLPARYPVEGWAFDFLAGYFESRRQASSTG